MATERNDGGPAFPAWQQEQGWDDDSGRYRDMLFPAGGMTLRDYFAAHAPRGAQSWFEPSMPTAKPEMTWDHDHDKCEMPWDCFPSNHDERTAWDKEREKQTAIQWPYAWADAMLKARDGK